MPIKFGLDVFLDHFPSALNGKRIGVVCHAASINQRYEHIVDLLANRKECRLTAIFGPQHGLFGQTQDNMIEWEGAMHPLLGIPIYSLYGTNRKPVPAMLRQIDALVIDLQDVGARPYTYIWTVKLCIEACAEAGIGVWILDRPNPIAALDFDGPMLDPEYFTFVGGAEIPLCHRMTMAEMALLIKQTYYPAAELHCISMDGWWRDSLFNETGLPWVLPSPNMPTLEAAVVYPGMVLLEATNMSEGRGTSRPFEIIGAPFVNILELRSDFAGAGLGGCLIREHGFIPTFNKWHGIFCNGIQLHVTDPRAFKPVAATAAIVRSILVHSAGEFQFKSPPYEYEMIKMPFDILAGSSSMRIALEQGAPLDQMAASWRAAHDSFKSILDSVSLYPETRP